MEDEDEFKLFLAHEASMNAWAESNVDVAALSTVMQITIDVLTYNVAA